MAPTEWRARISINPSIHHGDACISGTRVPVSVLVGSVADGDSFQQILESYPQITVDDLRAALYFAAEAVNRFDFVPATG